MLKRKKNHTTHFLLHILKHTHTHKHSCTHSHTHTHRHSGVYRGHYSGAEGFSAAQGVRAESMSAPWCVVVYWGVGDATRAYFTEGRLLRNPRRPGEREGEGRVGREG